MKLLSAVLVLAVSATAASAGPTTAWLYREAEDQDGAAMPTALFLDTDAKVRLRAQCDRATGELVVDYYGDGIATLTADDQFELILGDNSLPVQTVLTEGRLQGRMPAQTLLNAWSADEELEIFGPSEENDPWPTGKAEPLRTVAADCVSIAP